MYGLPDPTTFGMPPQSPLFFMPTGGEDFGKSAAGAANSSGMMMGSSGMATRRTASPTGQEEGNGGGRRSKASFGRASPISLTEMDDVQQQRYGQSSSGYYTRSSSYSSHVSAAAAAAAAASGDPMSTPRKAPATTSTTLNTTPNAASHGSNQQQRQRMIRSGSSYSSAKSFTSNGTSPDPSPRHSPHPQLFGIRQDTSSPPVSRMDAPPMFRRQSSSNKTTDSDSTRQVTKSMYERPAKPLPPPPSTDSDDPSSTDNDFDQGQPNAMSGPSIMRTNSVGSGSNTYHTVYSAIMDEGDDEDVDMSFFAEEEKQGQALELIDEGKSKIIDAQRVARWGGAECLLERLKHERDGQFDGGVIEDLTGEPYTLFECHHGGVRSRLNSSLVKQPGSTHVLLSQVHPPEAALPLLQVLIPTISSTLVVLDLHDNGLPSLPIHLTQCHALEELNISNNPIGLIPDWMGELTELRVLVADGCGLKTLPSSMMRDQKLHTMCSKSPIFIS